MTPRRFSGLACEEVLGLRIPVAEGPWARLLGLALIDRSRAGPGLLIPRCSSVHTFGMRFALDVVFLDAAGTPIEVRRAVGPGRFLGCRRARAVLEVPDGALGRVDGPC